MLRNATVVLCGVLAAAASAHAAVAGVAVAPWWSWLALLDRGDMLGLAGIGILAGYSAVALLALVPMYASGRDRAFAGLCLAEAAVLLAAASGLVVE